MDYVPSDADFAQTDLHNQDVYQGRFLVSV